jgi:hypothetical protein
MKDVRQNRRGNILVPIMLRLLPGERKVARGEDFYRMAVRISLTLSIKPHH